jgi:hypothetical protein
MMAQPNTARLQVSNQSGISVVSGQIKGDKFIPVDSSMFHPLTQSQRVNKQDNCKLFRLIKRIFSLTAKNALCTISVF